jgi:glycosyltransferase involved in cell wall biosynthesis
MIKIIYDNIIFSLQKTGGASVYWMELTKRLKKFESVTFFESTNNNIFRNEIEIDTICETKLALLLFRYLPFLKKIDQKSIFHSSHYRISLSKNAVNITTVHDFTYEYFRRGLPRIVHSWQKRNAIKNSDGIICVSENTKKDLIKFMPSINIEKIKVIYNGVNDVYRPLVNKKNILTGQFEGLNRKYILFVGARDYYKNFNIALEVVSKLDGFDLVVVGGGEFSKKEIATLEASIQSRYFHFLGLDNEKLNILYNNAELLIYPSAYEGFGIPILEAMRAGCPVVATKSSSIPEVSNGAALEVEKINVDSFLNKINLLNDRKFKDILCQKGFDNAKRFSWDKCYQETHSFYLECFNKK